MKRCLWLLIFLCTVLPAGADGPAVMLATTTSTQDTGLLDSLVPAFEQASGYSVKTIAVGTGAALAMGIRGDADVLLVHAPKAEERYMADGRGISRQIVMHNEFIIVGPTADPAQVHAAPNAAAALRRIAEAHALFITRADDSGTNKKELELWQAAGITPNDRWYIRSGSGMSQTLHIASERAAYTLTDDGTFLSQRATLALVPQMRDAPELANVYHVIVVKPIAGRLSNLAGAQAFSRYVVSPAGQELIANFGIQRYGRPLFQADAQSTTAH